MPDVGARSVPIGATVRMDGVAPTVPPTAALGCRCLPGQSAPTVPSHGRWHAGHRFTLAVLRTPGTRPRGRGRAGRSRRRGTGVGDGGGRGGAGGGGRG